jgi:hypothetical protein
MPKPPSVCYLCGKPLAPPINSDHVPPRQLYAKEVRKAHALNLLTISVHEECNLSYQHDEDYFVNTLAPFAVGSYAGTALLQEVFSKYKLGEKRPLVHKVLKEFQHTPGGINLPPGLVAKRIEGERVHRVAWKIVRGLYFHEFGEVLPEHTPNHLEITPPDRPPPEHFLQALHDLPSRGSYPGVFDYKYVQVAQLNGFNYWGMLFWDRLILMMAFHSLKCPCEHCQQLRLNRVDQRNEQGETDVLRFPRTDGGARR